VSAAPRLAVIGTGRMGRAVAALAGERGWDVVATLGPSGNKNGVGITRDSLAGADVAIEFTVPKAAAANVRAAVRAGCPVVSGTTGWAAQLAAIQEEIRKGGGTLFYAANFSIGVSIFADLVARAAEALARMPDFEAHIVETHHAAKKDAPSGTALLLERGAATALGRRVPVTSIRVGSVPGTHEVLFDAPFEQISLAHVARDRRVFADGALAAARWLIGRRGVFGMPDLIHSLGSDR
jgi:4-hydroxy-tetrahydrodipicolinate reductase